MRYFISISIIFLCLVLLTQNSSAQKGKDKSGAVSIGVVEVETIVKELPEAVSADKLLKELGQKYKDTLMQIQQEYQQKIEAYDKQKSMMSADQQKKEQDALKAIEQRFGQYQEEKFGMQGEIAQRRDKFLEPIRAKVKAAIEAVAKEESLNYVFDKGSSALLYAEEKSDITYRVLDKIKRGSGK